MNPFSDNPLVAIQAVAVARLFIAAVLGAILGIERTKAGKHAGMRTYALVSLGSCLFVVAGVLMEPWNLSGALDPTRIAASVVMGIGFIGSGLALLHAQKDHPAELTTAAGIWVAAGVGVAAGFGFYLLALCATALTVLVFTILLRVENKLRAPNVPPFSGQ